MFACKVKNYTDMLICCFLISEPGYKKMCTVVSSVSTMCSLTSVNTFACICLSLLGFYISSAKGQQLK